MILMMPKEEKRDELKKLFYSNLTSIELQKKLDLTHDDYSKLLSEVKKDLGLPSNYRRTPHRYGKYVKDSYFIKNILLQMNSKSYHMHQHRKMLKSNSDYSMMESQYLR